MPAVINGRLRRLTIVGVALSPEFIYSIRPGEMVPDDRRFGIFWMDEQALAAAFDMEGGFNDVVLALAPGASTDEVISRLDRLLEPYGGLGAIPRALQLSHWTVENELAQLQTLRLHAAAHLPDRRRLHPERRADARAGAAAAADRRAQGARLRQPRDRLALPEVGAGHRPARRRPRRRPRRDWLGQMLIGLYNQFFRFPGAALQRPARRRRRRDDADARRRGRRRLRGGAARRPRSAGRGDAARSRRRATGASLLETPFVARHLGTAGRMVLRNVMRHPFRAAASIFGIAFAVAILDDRLRLQRRDRSPDRSRSSGRPSGRTSPSPSSSRAASGARYALARLPGVVAVEPQRTVAARIRSGHRDRYLAITGVPPTPRFKRIVDRDGRAMRLPPSGVVLSHDARRRARRRSRATTITLEVLEGQRPVRQVAGDGLVDDILGLSAYMDVAALHQMMREGDVATGALLLIDRAQEARLSAELKTTPAVAGAGFKRAVLQSFRDVMAANMNLSIFINLIFAGIIAFGVVYNAARVSLSERSRELASLRVLGFTRAEISLILMGELALLTLVALPVGGLFGYSLSAAIVGSIDSEVYRFPLYVSRRRWRGRFWASSPPPSSPAWWSGGGSIGWTWWRS